MNLNNILGSVQPQQVAGISAGGATAMNPGGVSQVTQAALIAFDSLINVFKSFHFAVSFVHLSTDNDACLPAGGPRDGVPPRAAGPLPVPAHRQHRGQGASLVPEMCIRDRATTL